MDNIITVKSNLGLDSIAKGNGEMVSATLFKQDTKNRNEDGEYVAEYKNKPFPGSKKFLSPKWDALRKSWSWGGSATKFKEIVDQLNLRYPKSHRRSGEIIVAGDLERHKRDFKDPIFHHPDLIAKVFIEGGTGTLNLDIPEEAFIYYCNRSLRSIADETSTDGKLMSPQLRAGATMVFSNSRKASTNKRKTTDYFLDAMNVIINNKHDEPKLKMFAELFDIPGLSSRSDINELVNTLTTYVREHGENIQRGSGFKSLNEAIVAHSKMEDDELQHRYIVKLAKKKGHIRTSKDGFMLLGKMVEGPKSLDDIYLYFAAGGETATERFVALLEKMRELREIE